MAQFINPGAKGLAPGDWSGAGIADGEEMVIDETAGPISNDLDHSGLTTGLEKFEVFGKFESDIGGDGAGVLDVDVDFSSDAVLRYRAGGGKMYHGAAGRTVSNLDIGGAGHFFGQGGTYTDLSMDGAAASFSATATVVSAYLYDGTSVFEDHATIITLAEVSGGVHTFKRHLTTLLIFAGTAILDTEGDTTVTVKIYPGGTLRHLSGNITNLHRLGGLYDASQLKRPATVATLTQGKGRSRTNRNLTISATTQQAEYYRPGE